MAIKQDTKNLVTDLGSYQDLAWGTVKKHPPITERDRALLNWALGIGGEAGEVLGLVKHSVFSQELLDPMEVAKELGDVLWYLSAFCSTLGIDLQDVALLNILKLRHRYQGSYTHAASGDRHTREEAFKNTKGYKQLKTRILDGFRKNGRR